MVKLVGVPYMREPMDAISDPRYRAVMRFFLPSVPKPIRLILNRDWLFQHGPEHPASMLWGRPSVQIAQDFSKERLSVMLEACPVLRGKVGEAKNQRFAEPRICENDSQAGFFLGGNSPRSRVSSSDFIF